MAVSGRPDIVVARDGRGWHARFAAAAYPCAIGRGGARRDKREGDGATPVGCWPIRRVLYRPDRLEAPESPFPTEPLRPSDGWCDDPEDAAYNQAVTLPCAASHEALWRTDEVYDVIAVLGYNDAPVRPGAGSAVFLHAARPDYAPTAGCVALALPDLLQVLAAASPHTRLCVYDG